MKQIKVASVIIRDGKVFATQRGYGEFKDWWEFPARERGLRQTSLNFTELGRLLQTAQSYTGILPALVLLI